MADTFRVQRSAVINAPAERLFDLLSDFRNWASWSPWEKLDPAMKQTYDGSEAGVGAVSAWAGNKEVGEGKMTIVESRPFDLVRIKLDFEKPFKATSTAEFTFKPEGDQTLVTWSMFGKNDFMGKAISLIMDCDKMVGGDFEKGLASMKAVVESPAEKGGGKKSSDEAVTKTE